MPLPPPRAPPIEPAGARGHLNRPRFTRDTNACNDSEVEWNERRHGKLAVDFETVSRLRTPMDEDTADLVAALCAQIGMIMEDASAVALTISRAGEGKRRAAIANIEVASERIAALVRAVRALHG